MRSTAEGGPSVWMRWSGRSLGRAFCLSGISVVLAVRLGAAIGRGPVAGGCRAPVVLGACFPPSLCMEFLLSAHVCVCVYFEVPSPPTRTCDDRLPKPTSRERDEREPWKQTYTEKHTWNVTHMHTHSYEETYMHRQIQTHWYAHARTHIVTQRGVNQTQSVGDTDISSSL